MKAIVTGSTGFIGKFLVRELLNQGYDVIAVNRRSTGAGQAEHFKSVECMMSEYDKLPELVCDRDIDVVFHMAWQGVSGLEAIDESIQIQNIKATLDLMEAVHRMNIPTFVGAGSMYEPEAIIEMRDDVPTSNLKLYSKAAKTAAHWMAKAKAGMYDIRFFWPLINTYGEEEDSPRLLNSMIRMLLNGETPELSAGNQYYDFVHVKDVARALMLIADKGVDGTNYCISSGMAKPLKEFLTIAASITEEEWGGYCQNYHLGRLSLM